MSHTTSRTAPLLLTLLIAPACGGGGGGGSSSLDIPPAVTRAMQDAKELEHVGPLMVASGSVAGVGVEHVEAVAAIPNLTELFFVPRSWDWMRQLTHEPVDEPLSVVREMV